MASKSKHGSGGVGVGSIGGVKVTVEVQDSKSQQVADLSAQLLNAMNPPQATPTPAGARQRPVVSRSDWSGLLSMGALVFPVKTYSATDEDKVSFNMYHSATCKNRLNQNFTCSACGEEVSKADTYWQTEAENGVTVHISKEEQEMCQTNNDGVLEILKFVAADSVDPLYFESTDYIAPGGKKVGEVAASRNAFALLRLGMVETKTVAIGKRVRRGKDQIVVLRPNGLNGMVMQYLWFESEIKVMNKWVDVPVEIAAPVVRAGVELINAMTEEFDPAEYSDSYTNNLRALIAEKSTEKPVTKRSKKAAPAASGDDFMSILNASTAAAKSRKKVA